MTIALVVKVNDGYVLASDSATTFATLDPAGGVVTVHNIYNNANKIFNLYKGLPISLMTWGLGNVGLASISTLAKDLRARFTSGSQDWKLEAGSYTMADVAEKVKEFFYDEHYEPFATAAKANGETVAALGLSVAGYGAGEDQPEIFQLELSADGCTGPTEILDTEPAGAAWWGQYEAISRLLNGVSVFVPQALINLGKAADEAEAVAFAQDIADQVRVGIVGSAMPIQDAIDLAEFLVRVTIGFVRFCPGHPTVGGPIEIAAVTKHEGF
ncbi:hypothetical protein [Mycobacterium avium]|uniref:hypothetical protein n=1 Tax=Mycobacterium avium TaxID=1764 RepID=UPI001CC4A548|nr:hypothetical protein [Mycobacterium avium]MBZ4622564.1 hypothetical protein [Mycobacterium avium subsp. hominissuis]